MHINALRGNEETLATLSALLQAGRLPHALLLAGPDGCGRNALARRLAADLLAPEGGPAAEAVLNLQSPELLLVEGEGASGQIKVDRIRQVRAEIFRTGLSANGRVVYIQDAHRMMAPAANALLKVLEEPPPGAHFILTASSAEALPVTIASRCARYPLAPLPAEACRAVLQAAPEAAAPAGIAEPAGLLAAVYGGRVGPGLAALRCEKRFALLADALAAAAAAASRSRYGLLRVFAGYEARGDEGRERRDALLSDLADVLSALLRGETAAGLPALSPAGAAALLPPVLEARRALTANAAPKLCFAALAIQLTPSER